MQPDNARYDPVNITYPRNQSHDLFCMCPECNIYQEPYRIWRDEVLKIPKKLRIGGVSHYSQPCLHYYFNNVKNIKNKKKK